MFFFIFERHIIVGYYCVVCIQLLLMYVVTGPLWVQGVCLFAAVWVGSEHHWRQSKYDV